MGGRDLQHSHRLTPNLSPAQLDIMDRGTNAVQYIRGDVIPLQLGYIGASALLLV